MLGALLLWFGLFTLYIFQPYFGSADSDSEFGYYGPYNRVKHVLESMPNVRVVAYRRHEDTVLEGFGFTLLLDGTREVQISAYAPEMRTWRESWLREFIQRQIDANQPPEPWQKGLFPDSYYEKSPELKAWRRRQPDPVPPEPVDQNQPKLARRELRPGESLPRSTDTNQPAGKPVGDQSRTTAQPR